MPPPTEPQELPAMVLSVTVTVPVLLFKIAPPAFPTWLSEIVQPVRVTDPVLALQMAPASNVAELFVMSVFVILIAPVLLFSMQARLVAKLPEKVLPLMVIVPVPSWRIAPPSPPLAELPL